MNIWNLIPKRFRYLRAKREDIKNRINGCFFGAAVGDALGLPLKGLNKGTIMSKYGFVTEYLPHPAKEKGYPLGMYSKDTQLLYLVANSLAEGNGFNQDNLVEKLIGFNSNSFFTDKTYKESIKRLKDGCSWKESGILSEGCGAAMRAGPLGIFYYYDPKQIERIAIDSTRITHNNDIAIAGAMAVAYCIGYFICCSGYAKGLLVKGLRNFIEERSVELAWKLYSVLYSDAFENSSVLYLISKKLGDDKEAAKKLCEILKKESRIVGHTIDVVSKAFHYTIYYDSFKDAVFKAVNEGGDANSVGAITGAMHGVLGGIEAIPMELIDGLYRKDIIYNLLSASRKSYFRDFYDVEHLNIQQVT